MSAYRRFEESRIGQAMLFVIWLISLPIQLVLFVGIGLYGAITGRDVFR